MENTLNSCPTSFKMAGKASALTDAHCLENTDAHGNSVPYDVRETMLVITLQKGAFSTVIQYNNTAHK